MCNIDECNSFGSNAIYYPGREKFTPILILRKLNCNLLSSSILEQHPMNSCGDKRECLRCELLNELRRG
jgi:hypothetical protein